MGLGGGILCCYEKEITDAGGILICIDWEGEVLLGTKTGG